MGKVYYSGDIETSGPVAPLYAMLSVGFCTTNDRKTTFYAELQPITTRHEVDAVRVGCRGLSFMPQHKGDPVFDPESDRFDAGAILEELRKRGEEPSTAMRRLARWVEDTAKQYSGTPRALYAPASFESGFLPYYFHRFVGENPFGHSAEDASSYLRGALGDESANLAKLGLRPEHGLTHNALDDAIQQAREFEAAREIARENGVWRGIDKRS